MSSRYSFLANTNYDRSCRILMELFSKFIINDPAEIIRHSDVLIVVNNDEEFKDILSNAPKGKIIYDLVNVNFKNKDKKERYIGISW